MQALNTVRLEDRLVTADDLANCVPVTKTLPTASEVYVGKYFFLSEVYRAELVHPSFSPTYEVLLPGKIYKCLIEYETNISTGSREKVYRWRSVSFKENGKLSKPENLRIVTTENDASIGGYTKQLWWEDPKDVTNSDPSKNAIWAYTVIIRKIGSLPPTSPLDGDVVGYSSVRNQYVTGVGFADLVPEDNYAYNVFAVTRYGIATGSTDSGGTEMDWMELRSLVRSGNVEAVLRIGDAVVVKHDQLGNITLRVVDINAATIDESKTSAGFKKLDATDEAGRPLYRSLVLMSTTSMFRTQYDANELSVYDGVNNPGDQGQTEKWCSRRGRCNWKNSNLRQWLNQLSPYTSSGDTIYNVHKCYYTRTGSGSSSDPYVYTPVSTPLEPEKVNPHSKGYYEATWNFVKDHNWDTAPMPFRDANPDAGYVFNNRQLPGFLTGFDSSFVNALAYTKVTTVTDPFLFDHRSSDTCYQVTSDRIFIPSYRQLYGMEPPGIRDVSATMARECYEGTQFRFYNPEYAIPDLTIYDRSYHMRDLSGFLSGYYMRTPETTRDATSGGWNQTTASGVQCVSSDGYTSPAPLSKAVTPFSTVGCSMSAEEARHVNVDNVYTAPGIAWCCVIA